MARIRTIALTAPEIAGRLISTDGRVGGLTINFVLPDDPDAAVMEITDYLNAALDQARESHPGTAYYLTGDVVMHRAFAEATRDDLQFLVPIVFLVIAASAAILLRSFLATLSISILLVFIVNTTMGFAGWLGTVMSPTNAGVPIIVMAVAVADSIHIVTSTLLGMGRGLSRNAAIAASVRTNAYPVFLTTLTTVIGFLSLNASDSPPFRVLGNLVAFGVSCAFVYSMLFLPALLSILPLRARLLGPEKTLFFERFSAFVVAKRKFLLWIVPLLAIGLIMGIPRNQLSDNWPKYFDERYQFRRDTDFVIENLTGLDTLEYSLKAGREGGITDPEYLAAVEKFAEWYRTQPEVDPCPGVSGHHETPEQEHARRRSRFLPIAERSRTRGPIPVGLRAVASVRQ